MAVALNKIPFNETLLPKVQSFDCGDEPWDREVSDWLKSPREQAGAVLDLENGNDVWLYVNDTGDLVGVGSLGIASLAWPVNKSPRIAVSIIPMLGVDRRFQGQPPGPREGRYSTKILSDLIAEATLYRTDRPALILYVNEKNAKAIAWYAKFGFSEFGKPYTDPETGFVNLRLLLVL